MLQRDERCRLVGERLRTKVQVRWVGLELQIDGLWGRGRNDGLGRARLSLAWSSERARARGR